MTEYGQREQMENEAIVHTLDTQARAIWPQERDLIKRIFPKPGFEMLDVGCGTGEISIRVAKEFSPARVVGVDLSEINIGRARDRAAGSPLLSFETGDAHHLRYPENSFDAAICRHMLQAIPGPIEVIREMIRVVRPNGWLYFLAEDYGMLFFHPTRHDTDEFFSAYGGKASRASGSDLRQGRKMPAILTGLGCAEIKVDYLCIDTFRVDRNLLAEIFLHWRDGFAAWISEQSGKPIEDVLDRFNDMIECTRNPKSYAAWLIPSISARVPVDAKKGGR